MVECQLLRLTPLLILLTGLTFPTQERASAPILTQIQRNLASHIQDCFGGKLIVCLAAAKMARQNRAMLK